MTVRRSGALWRDSWEIFEAGAFSQLDLVVQPVGIAIIQAHIRTLLVPQPRVLDRDDGVRRHASCQPGGGADHRVVADSRLAAQERRIGVDDDFVLDGRVPLVTAEDLAGRFIARKTDAPSVTP